MNIVYNHQWRLHGNVIKCGQRCIGDRNEHGHIGLEMRLELK